MDVTPIIIAHYLYIYVGFFAGIIGSVGNILNNIIFGCMKKYRVLPSSVFLAGASFGEELAVVALIFPQSFASATGRDPRAMSTVFCKISSLFYTGGGSLSILCLYVAATDRYLQTSRSASLRQWMTLKKARIIFFINLTIAATVGLPFGVFRDVVPITQTCDYVSITFTQIAFFFYSIVGFLFPLVLLTGTVYLTFRNLRQTRERQAANQNANNLTQHVTRMILLQTIIIVISILPGATINLYGILLQKDSLMATPIELLILTITQILTYTNSCTSFYVYLIMSPTFRQHVMRMFGINACNRIRIVPQPTLTRSTNLPRTQHH